MNIKPGIKLLEETQADGRRAEKGDQVVYNLRIYLNRGDEVPMNAQQAGSMAPERLRTVDGYEFVDHVIQLGKRQSMAAVEQTLLGMCEGSYRKVQASPHLAYGRQGVPNLIPPDAVLVLEIWLRNVIDDT